MAIRPLCPDGEGRPRKKNLGPIKLYRETLMELAETVGRAGTFSSEWTDSEGVKYAASTPSDIPDLAKVLAPSLRTVVMARSDPDTGEKIIELVLSPQAALLVRHRIEETADVAARIGEICAEHRRTWTKFAGIHGLIVGTALAIVVWLVAGLLLGPLAAQFWLAVVATVVAVTLGLGLKFVWKRVGANLTQAVMVNVPEKAQGGVLSRKRDDLVIAVIVLLLSTAINVSLGLLLRSG
jgi:hypothetical protein